MLNKIGLIIFLGVSAVAIVAGGLFLQLQSSAEKADVESENRLVTPVLPVREIRFGMQWEDLEFQIINQEDSGLERGQSQVRQTGKRGARLSVYKYLFEDGRQVGKTLYFFYSAIKPADQVVAIGTAEPEPVYYSYQSDGEDEAAAAAAREAEEAAAWEAARQAHLEQVDAAAKAWMQSQREWCAKHPMNCGPGSF